MNLLIKGIIVFALIFLAGRVLNHLFPAKRPNTPNEEEAPIIDVDFEDVTDSDGDSGDSDGE